MNALILEKTQYTPAITLDPQNNRFELVGQSFPENTFAFYEPVIAWLENYFDSKKECTIKMDLKYLNSSSLKSFFDIFELLDSSVKNHKSKITIEWIYDVENDISLEIGENMDEDFEHIKIKYVPKER